MQELYQLISRDFIKGRVPGKLTGCEENCIDILHGSLLGVANDRSKTTLSRKVFVKFHGCHILEFWRSCAYFSLDILLA